MKLTIALVLAMVALAAAKTVPTTLNTVEHHEEHAPETEQQHVENAEKEITKRYTVVDSDPHVYGPHKYYEISKTQYHGYDPETSSVKYGKHINVGGKKDITIDFTRDDGGITKTVKFGSDSYPYHTDREYYYPGKYIDYKQTFSPYDFSSKVHAKFDKMNQYKYGDYEHRYGDLDSYEKTPKTKKSTEEEEEHSVVKDEHVTKDAHHADVNKHDVAVNKRSSFEYTPEYLRYDIGHSYSPFAYDRVHGQYGMPSSYHGVNRYPYYGKGYPIHGDYQQQYYGNSYYPYHTSVYNKGYPSHYYSTPYSYDSMYSSHFGGDDIETRVEELKDWLKKYEEIKKLSKKYTKRENTEENVEEQHHTSEHAPMHVEPSMVHGVPHFGEMH